MGKEHVQSPDDQGAAHVPRAVEHSPHGGAAKGPRQARRLEPEAPGGIAVIETDAGPMQGGRRHSKAARQLGREQVARVRDRLGDTVIHVPVRVGDRAAWNTETLLAVSPGSLELGRELGISQFWKAGMRPRVGSNLPAGLDERLQLRPRARYELGLVSRVVPPVDAVPARRLLAADVRGGRE